MSEERDEQSRASILSGGLPLNAMDRLREQARRKAEGKPFFTSDLSVNELVLTHTCGFEPLGQVMGSSVYHVGWFAGAGWSWVSGEMDVLTEAYREARHLATSRLQQEAKLLEADGVVGVRVTQTAYDWAAGTLEFMAIGTAVRDTSAPPLAEGAQPFVSGLSGQDHYALRSIGMRPCGLVMGNCIWAQYLSWKSQNAMNSLFGAFFNQELPEVTQALYMARELAMDRMEGEARRVGATGVVGVAVESSDEPFEQNNTKGMILRFSALGTAVSPDTNVPMPQVKPVVSLRG